MHQVHKIVNAMSTSFENKCYCTGVFFLDISQAFNQVWHKSLLIKLYLTNRHFQICYGSSSSGVAIINAGIPQGAILSLIFFNIYASNKNTSSNTTIAGHVNDKVT